MTERLPRHPGAARRQGPPPGRSRRPAERRERTLSRDTVVAAALRVLDAEGVDAVTMRRVAHELGTGPASLYAHVEDKDELLRAVFDRVLGEIDLTVTPDPDHWQEQVKDFAREVRRVLLAHRDLAKVNLGSIPTGPNAMRGMEAMLTILAAAGLPPKVIGYAGDLFAQFVAVSAYELSLFRAQLPSPAHREEWHRQLTGFFEGLPAEEFPTIRRFAHDFTDPDEHEDTRFEFGLEVFVRGLAAHLDPPRRRR